MDRAEQILQALAAAGAATGYPVEIDRDVPLDDSEAPIVIVRSGGETSEPVDKLLWNRRWTITPNVEIYVTAASPAAARAAISAAWTALVAGVESAGIPKLIARGTGIEASREQIEKVGRFFACQGTFAFTFDR
jgi:hypothetical protein